MDSTTPTPPLVRATLGLEKASFLDGPARALEPHVRRLFGSGSRGALLRGDWLGHALHPVLTDATMGSWTSATVLDLIGGQASAAAAQRLVGVGLLVVGPTAWTGWAQWVETGERDKRVGLVHAATNGAAAALYASSWLARRRGERGLGIRRALAGAAVASVGGHLGGHLAQARHVGTTHPAYTS
jgi:hypothetical protein